MQGLGFCHQAACLYVVCVVCVFCVLYLCVCECVLGVLKAPDGFVLRW